MKEKFLLIVLFIRTTLFSQSHELGIIAGGSNYIGDIGDKKYIAPNDFSIGAVYRLNRSKRHTYRLSYTHYSISAKDKDSEVVNKNLRGLEFENTVKELAVGMEFSFWNFDLHTSGPQATPYIHSGLSLINFKNLSFIGKNINESGTKTNLAIPITVGFKMRLIDQIILSAEVSAKYTFTDNLDGSNPEDASDARSFGNITNKDWYVFSGILLTYTFGKTPCFCNF